MVYKYAKKIGVIFLVVFGLLTAGQAFSGNKQIMDRYLNYIEVSDAIEYKNLKIFPIVLKQELSTKSYVTLDQAYKQNCLSIRELKSATVNTIEIQNNGSEPVFIMTGEIIKGAKQDRMVKNDILLEPNGKVVEVPVYCVEHGRWRHVSSEFKSADKVAPSSVRKGAKISCNQSEVWNCVASVQKDCGVASETGTLMDSYEDKNTKQELDLYEQKFERIPDLSDRTIGVIVTTGNKIVCFDLFANNNLFKKLWNKLIKSYALDGLSGTKSTVRKKEVESFVDQIEGLGKNAVGIGTIGLGQLYELDSDFGKGSALVDDASVVHMDFFIGEKVVYKTPKSPCGNRMAL